MVITKYRHCHPPSAGVGPHPDLEVLQPTAEETISTLKPNSVYYAPGSFNHILRSICKLHYYVTRSLWFDHKYLYVFKLINGFIRNAYSTWA